MNLANCQSSSKHAEYCFTRTKLKYPFHDSSLPNKLSIDDLRE